MRNQHLTTLLSLALVATVLPVNGQESNTALADKDAQPSFEATHDEIRELRDALIKAVNDSDVDSLANLVHEDVVLTAQDGDELSTIRSRAGVREYMNRLLIGPDAGVRKITVNPVVDELTILYGDDTGIAFGTSADHYVLADDSEFDLPTRWSATIVKNEGEWQVASLHVSSNLFDNPVLNAMSKYAMLGAIVIGLLGLILGFVVARFSIRKSTHPADS